MLRRGAQSLHCLLCGSLQGASARLYSNAAAESAGGLPAHTSPLLSVCLRQLQAMHGSVSTCMHARMHAQ
jgi:hypothetical protein